MSLSSLLLENVTLFVAFIILLFIIFIGIIFDVIGIAVTSADEGPFHSMASDKVYGAKYAIRLVKNADVVSNICNDVVGDICSVVSGVSVAIIITKLIEIFPLLKTTYMSIAMSAVVSTLTIGGKAMGKSIAIDNNLTICLFTGKILAAIHDKTGIEILADMKTKNKKGGKADRNV
jgi:CBS domain containing-hemolysin-like protein